MKSTTGISRIVKVTNHVLAAAVALIGAAIVALPAVADPAISLRNAMNNKCLEIMGFHNENGASAGLWDCWGGANQQWYWDGRQIRSSMNNKCLELLSFRNENGASVGLWDCWGGANQQWYRDGRQIRNAMNNKCLELTGFRNENGAKVGLWECWGGANQQWY